VSRSLGHGPCAMVPLVFFGIGTNSYVAFPVAFWREHSAAASHAATWNINYYEPY
jgi:hypothetical protein